MSVLEQIIDADPQTIANFTWNGDKERQFKYCLSLVKTKARIEGKTLFIRPINVPEFGNVLNAHGLGFCEVTKQILLILNGDPAESVRFAHPVRKLKNIACKK